MSRPTEDIFETSSFASLIHREEQEEIIPLDLHTASLIGDVDAVKGYIERKKNLDIVNRGGWTPLMYAAYVGRNNILSLLIEAGASVDIKSSKDGLTALMLASYCASEQIMFYLIQHGASINTRDANGMTSLFHAVRQGHQSAVNLLANHRAELDSSQTSSGITPIMEAAIAGHDNIFNILLEHGADLRRCTKKGETIRSLAMRYGNQTIVTLIDKHCQPAFNNRNLRGEPTLSGRPGVASAGSGGGGGGSAPVSLAAGPAQIHSKIQDQRHPSSASSPELTPLAAIVPDFHKIGPYPPDHNTDVNMTDGSQNKDNRKASSRIATEPPKPVFMQQSSVESIPLPQTLLELLTQYNLQAHYPKFQQRGVELFGFLELTDNDLKDMEIDKLGHRKKICMAIKSSKERLKQYGSPVEAPQTEKLQQQIQVINAKLHEAYAYIKEQQLNEQRYRTYLESEQQLKNQFIFNTNDFGKNCKEALGHMQKVKEFNNQTEIILQKLKEHPNGQLLSNELGIDPSYCQLASSVKPAVELATNRLELSLGQVERTLLMAQVDRPQHHW